MAKAGVGRYARSMAFTYVDSPVGRLAVESDGKAVTGVRWASRTERVKNAKPDAVLREAAKQLSRYFTGKLKRFDVPIDTGGTDHQKRVWEMMQEIPWGETATYGGIAMALGSGARAVGTACGRNCIVVIVPCHRVLGSGGRIGGYSGGRGLATKRDLLALEGVTVR
jgi:methylated-DNA-[protein]-cysteine S-methyltransferase